MRLRRTTRVTEFESDNFKNLIVLVLFCFVFYLLFFINADRNTVSSPPPQIVLIEEVAYVKKIIVTGGTHTPYSL